MTQEVTHHNLPSLPSVEIGSELFNTIMLPDEVLAGRALDARLQAAEADPNTAPEALGLLRLQRNLVSMPPEDALGTAVAFARETGKHASFGNNGDGTIAQLHYPLNRSSIVRDLANEERWHALGINPDEEYGTDPYANAYRSEIEDSWREARQARQALAEAQAAEARALDRLSSPLVFEPRNLKK